jgi:hypothetical protein
VIHTIFAFALFWCDPAERHFSSEKTLFRLHHYSPLLIIIGYSLFCNDDAWKSLVSVDFQQGLDHALFKIDMEKAENTFLHTASARCCDSDDSWCSPFAAFMTWF